MTNQISILGCGWLGLPLANFLIKSGFVVKGSTTNLDKISILENNKIQAFQIELSEIEIKGEIDSFLKNSEILIIDIPPKLRGVSSENFVKKIQNLIPFIEKCKIKKVLFISSTSVYSDKNKIITEQTKPNPETESGKQLLETETILQSNTNFKTTVIRFGGLIGEDRHPIHFLAGRKNIENPEAPINLIHQKDCIGIIKAVIEQNCFGEIFNAVAPFHPTRKDYYSKKAQQLNILAPKFEVEKNTSGKIIMSDKLITELNYNFIYESL